MKLYCISGLGVDHRAFRNLQIEGVELVHIPWIDPIKNESLSEYATRLFQSVKLPDDYNLIGVSFGGMIAQEFKKIRKPRVLFLVSTISNSSELSGLFKFGGKLKLHKVVPGILIKRTNWFSYFLFGAKTKEDKTLLKEILHDSDGSFFRWAMGAIVQWKNASRSKGIRLHGTKDKILPARGKPEFSIQDAGHFMIVTHGEELSQIIGCAVREKEKF
jgi:pimeloyl-ACP methyl ester carboxylesterase